MSWPTIEKFFGELPPELFRQGVLLRHNLATRYSDSGQYEEILTRPADPPLLRLAEWLQHDLAGVEQPEFDQHLFCALVYAFSAVYAHETMLDPDSNFDYAYQQLEQALRERSQYHFQKIFSPIAAFWAAHDAAWQAVDTALQFEQSRWRDPRTFETADLAQIAERHAIWRLPIYAVCATQQRLDLIEPLIAIVNELMLAYQASHDLLALRRDLARRHFTYPIEALRALMGDKVFDAPDQALGTLVVFGVGRKLCVENVARVEKCRALIAPLNLPAFAAGLAAIHADLETFQHLLSLKATPATTAAPKSFLPAVDSLSKVLEMAEGYLLADRDFKESWDTQRRGVFGLPTLVGYVFGPGLIIEVLSQHHHDLSAEIGVIFQRLYANEFRYYPHPTVAPDADDFALLLRLYAFAPTPEHRRIIEEGLQLMRANIGANGRIASWFTRKADGQPDADLTAVLWGSNCVTVDANLLMSLMAYPTGLAWEGIERAAEDLLMRYQESGLGANKHYIAPYALWAGFEFVTELLKHPLSPALNAQAQSVRAYFLERVKQIGGAAAFTPLEAAFLVLVCARHPNPDARALLNPHWSETLLKHQRPDGSWRGEPLFIIPARGEVATWYSSHQVTTAFCYHALKSLATTGG